jgi:hypothetical protein
VFKALIYIDNTKLLLLFLYLRPQHKACFPA